MDGVFFSLVIVLPYLMEILTDSNCDRLRNIFFLEDLVQRGPAFIVFSGRLLDFLNDPPDGIDKQGKYYSHQEYDKTAVGNRNRISGSSNAITDGGCDF